MGGVQGMEGGDGMSELKPCPFCGGEAKSYVRDYGDTHYWRVSCSSDRCGVNPVTNVYHTESGAIEAWNIRAERTCHSEYSDRWECSECGFLDAYVTADFINYCPNCGAKVVE